MIPDSEVLREAISCLLNWHTIGVLALGVIGGFIAGAIPGFSEGNLMILVLPFTVYLAPADALVLLVAIFMTGQASASIPAILMRIPGTPSTVVSTFDGYPLTLKGKAAQAIGASFLSSAIGGFVGTLFLFFLTPVIGAWSLKFASPEVFMLAVFGLAIIGALSGDYPVKGLLSAALGVVFASIGLEYTTGIPRATFGVVELYDGIPQIPVLLGMFGLAELLVTQFSDDSATPKPDPGKGFRKPIEGMREILKFPGAIIRSSLIGTLVGALPGAGPTVGTFLSYGQAKQSSKRPQDFGKGSYEGLLASDVANNAVVGGSLIPLLSLGIPGSSMGAVLLASLVMHGFRPGPGFFTKFTVPSYVIFLSLLIVCAFLLLCGLFVARFAPRIVQVPKHILVPVVLIMVLLGGFAWRYYWFDVVLLVFFGLLGVLMHKNGYSPAAFVLAFVLAPMAEVNLLRSLQVGGIGYILRRPIVWTLAVLSVLTIVMSLRAIRLADRRLREATESSGEDAA